MDRGLIAQTRGDAGITLVELLVVTAVLSVLAVGVSLTAVRSTSKNATSDGEWFRNQFQLQQSLAIQERSSRGLSITNKGLAIAARRSVGWETKKPARAWRGKVTLGRTAPRRQFDGPDIVFLPNGQTTAFELVFSSRQGGPAQRCRSDGWTGVTCSNP